MKYTIRRFSWTGETHSVITHEETVNGKTSGEIEVNRGKYQSGHKPVQRSIKLKYHARRKPI